MTNNDSETVKPLVMRPRVARQMYGDCSADELYDKIKAGDVESYSMVDDD